GDYEASANSQVNNGNKAGGLWSAKNKQEQLIFYHKIMANYLYQMVKHDIQTIFIDFDQMITEKSYLYEKLKIILDDKNINVDSFNNNYDLVSATSRPRPGNK